MKLFEAIIDVPGRGGHRVTITATDLFAAQRLLELQFGRGMVRAVRRI